jgi:nucleoside-specific outer membrane channel protein Tsx
MVRASPFREAFMHAHRAQLHAALIAAVATLLLAPATSRAGEGFSTTNVQVLQGWNFHDNLLGYDTKSGEMTTVTLNHFSTWEYGDNFAFFDLYRGEFTGGYQSDLYAEWHPRLFLDQVLGQKPGGFIRHWGIAGEINQARGFYAYLAGAGLDLAIPGFAVAGLNVYYRYDNFNYHTWQVSPFWTVPFSLGPVPFVFTGFVDVFQDKNGHYDVMAQPELLVDVLKAAGGKRDRLYVGVEWYVHSYQNFVDDKNKVVSAPQAMVQWTVY